MDGLFGSGRLGLRGAAIQPHTICPNRPGNILELLLACILECEVGLVANRQLELRIRRPLEQVRRLGCGFCDRHHDCAWPNGMQLA
jgi:hypothetical protein